MDILVQFLFYFYRKKTRYIEYIIEICMKLDDNNNGTIVFIILYSKLINLCS